MRIRLAHTVALATGIAAFAACSGDETAPVHNTPVDARLYVQGAEVTPHITLAAAQTVRIEVRFVDADGDEIAGIETEHYAALTFSPASLATVAPVTGQRFFFDVTAQGAGGATGTVSVGYGHDDLADEDTFGPFDVTIQ